MIALIQRVSRASVRVQGRLTGRVERGVLALIGVQRQDRMANAERLAQRLLGYRIFADESGRMNLSVRDVDGGLLLVPQFTLAADTRKGTRASFSGAAEPALGKALFAALVDRVGEQHRTVATGEFGADMQVELVNEGPVTFWLEG